MEEHEKKAEEFEQKADEMDEKGDRLEGDIEKTRSDFEGKLGDIQAPGLQDEEGAAPGGDTGKEDPEEEPSDADE